jgi:CubicO group peptidase (beta-lactamase class C family)
MSSGLRWDENRPFDDPANNETGMLRSREPFRYILQQPVVAPAGGIYTYNGGGTSLLTETLVRRTGKPLADYAREKLFAPLDVAAFDWDSVGASKKLGSYGSLRLRPRDMLKLGPLMLNDGQWNGRRIVPTGWTGESSKPRILGEGLFFYGYQWWLGRSLVGGREVIYTAAFGIGGQRVYIVPEFDLVVAINSGMYASPLQAVVPSAILNRLVLPSLKD